MLKIINDLEKEGVIQNYALGGATALLFYAEPALTDDVDVFVFIPEDKTKLLVDQRPLYAALESKGYYADKEYIRIKGIPVQFLPAYNSLVEETVREAAILDYEGVPVKVARLEYLMAIMLKTNRPKDKARIGQLLEEDVVFDQNKFSDILSRYQLKKAWEKISGFAK